MDHGTKDLLRMQGPLLGLMGLMFFIFFAQAVFGPLWYRGLMVVPADVGAAWERLLAGQSAVSDWQIFGTLLSHAFLHGNFEHVLLNMLFFWIFAALIVELLGWRWMLMIFAVTAAAGGVAHVIMNRGETIPMLGASGAVMGVEGAYLALAMRWTLPDPHVWPIARPVSPSRLALVAVIGVGIDYFSIMQGMDTGIAYGAHVGGFTAGLLFAGISAPRPRGRGVVKR